jgi:hypothetical protein
MGGFQIPGIWNLEIRSGEPEKIEPVRTGSIPEPSLTGDGMEAPGTMSVRSPVEPHDKSRI